MAILSYASAVASQGASYAFSTATSYVLRPDPTSSTQSEGKENIKPLSSSSPSSGSHAHSTTSPSAKRLSRQSSSKARLPSYNASSKFGTPSSPSTAAPQSSNTSTASSSSTANGKGEAEDLVDSINGTDELYLILGVTRKAKSEEIRRGFLGRSRICHPDKLPHYPPSTTAFQRLSYAYETLSKPASRRIYDLGGMRSFETGGPTTPVDPTTADETLNGVLRSVINEFLHGDFEMIRVFVTALNEGSPGLNLGEDAIDNLESAFRRAREVLLAGQKYALLLKFSLIRMYEIQISLRRLSYFDLYGRLRLTMELARCMVEVPLILDKAMREDTSTSTSAQASYPASSEERDGGIGKGGQLESRGILGVRTKGMLVLTCRVLEKAERWTGGTSSPRGNWEDGEDATANKSSSATSSSTQDPPTQEEPDRPSPP